MFELIVFLSFWIWALMFAISIFFYLKNNRDDFGLYWKIWFWLMIWPIVLIFAIFLILKELYSFVIWKNINFKSIVFKNK